MTLWDAWGISIQVPHQTAELASVASACLAIQKVHAHAPLCTVPVHLGI